MNRGILLLSACALVGALVVPATASSDRGRGLDYDLDRVRQAQQAAAEQVGPMPEELGRYFAERPAFFAHPRSEQLEARSPELVYLDADAGYEAMREQLRSHLATRYRTMAAAAAEAGEPVVFKIPALMFRVHDDEWQEDSTPEALEAALSGTETSETGTVTEMYLEQSFGNMVLDIDVYGPYDSLLANGPQNAGGVCYYGTEGAPITGDVLGLGGLGARGMAVEAVPMADPDIDFGEYDNDLDGNLDFLIMLHSGPDAAATGDPCHVWSHYFPSIAGEPTVATQDRNAEGEPVVVGPVLTIPEVDLQIGVTAHEIMHALGEPDYYGTAGTAGTGDWDLGAGGSWSGIPAQTNPVHFNPVMKLNFGWVKPRVVTATTRDVALKPRASHPDLVMVPLKIAKADSEAAALCDQAPVGIPGQNNAFYTEDGDCLVEGFLLENVNRASAAWDQAGGFTPADFDRQLYGSGLGVWHWDFTNFQQLGNNNQLRPMLDLEEFDRRDDTQDLSRNLTRAQPLDLFWGDPVGMSGATQVPPSAGGVEPPEGSPWTVTALPGAGAPGTEATPMAEWEAAETPPGAAMSVTLSWDVETDDWDLYVDQLVDDEWVEVNSSAGGAPQTQESLTILDFEPGDRFRVRAYNWLGPTSPQAEVSVEYTGAVATQLGPVGTRDNDLEQTGWAITNIRPNDYRGLTHAAEQPRTVITVDLVKHDGTTMDVSGDFLRPDTDAPEPMIAGRSLKLVTNVYNHGGKAVSGATFELFTADPATAATPVATVRKDLAGFARDQVRFDYTPHPGLNELFVRATAAGDVTPGNDVVRTELEAWKAGAEVLLVDDDFGWTFEEPYESALNALGVPYAVADGPPTAETLGAYDAVIWLTTTVSGAEGVLSDDAQEAVGAYLDDGGRLWLASTRAAGYLTTDDPAWLASYFGFAVEQNLLNSMGSVAAVDESLAAQRTIDIGYLDGRPYIDYGAIPEEGVKGTATGLFAHADRPDHLIATQVEGEAGFRSVYGLPVGLLDDGAEQVKLTKEVLSFFGVETGAPAPSSLAVHYPRFQHVQIGEDWP
ncbi:MAG: immune inhibitor A domain-containing protein, partial [Nitriliruptorales bacterium]